MGAAENSLPEPQKQNKPSGLRSSSVKRGFLRRQVGDGRRADGKRTNRTEEIGSRLEQTALGLGVEIGDRQIECPGRKQMILQDTRAALLNLLWVLKEPSFENLMQSKGLLWRKLNTDRNFTIKL